MLTQQIRQQINKPFYNLLIRVRKRLLNNGDVDTPNSRIVSLISSKNVNKNVVIVQQNETRHIINDL